MISSGFDENNHEKDAFAVKHVFATNTGLHIFDSVSKLFDERNFIDTGDSLVEQCVAAHQRCQEQLVGGRFK